MSEINFYDSETTDLPDWKKPSDSPHQPHLVSLACIKCNKETREIIETMDVIVYQEDDWYMSPEAFAAHGITKEHSRIAGIQETDALRQFYRMCLGGETVAHNWYFDYRMIRIQAKRYGFDQSILDMWEKTTHHCTMKMAKPIMKMPPYRKPYGWKPPKLEEAYQFFAGKSLGDKAHSALPDATACMEIYWAIEDFKNQPTEDEPDFHDFDDSHLF